MKTALEELREKVFENFDENELKAGHDIPVWRYMRFDTFLELVTQKKLYLRKTLSWEDTYENFIYKAQISMQGRPIDFKEFAPNLYGQCWTTLNESDAMWRIYSSDKTGVVIKSSVNKLFNAFLNDYNEQIGIKIGKVKYLSKPEIAEYIKQHALLGDIKKINDFLLHCQFIKRKEFAHEFELRIIVFLLRDAERISLPIKPMDLIEEVIADPRMSGEAFNQLTGKLKEVGFAGSFAKSSLYESSQLIIDIP